jgi:ABC-type thiamine transport system substrate-binding protein
VTKLYRVVLGRDPSESEVGLALPWIKSANTESEVEGRWTTLTQNLLIGNEFFFVR